MSTHRAEIAAWFVVDFDDDGVNDLKDQAHEAAMLNDMEVINVAPLTE